MISEEILGNAFIAVGKRIKAGKCSMTQEQASLIMDELQKSMDVEVSKEEACAMLGISRSTFDQRVADGKLPEGRHVRGFKEKRWNKKELYGER